MPAISEIWADYALGLRVTDIPDNVRDHVKRLVLDTLACAIGGADSDAVAALVRAAESDLSGREEATLFGLGRRSTVQNAILVNGAMTRYLDANDVTPGGHTSEAIPPILALAEREGASGADVLGAIVVAYELSARFHLAIQGERGVVGRRLEDLGWNQDLRAGFIMPAVYGRLLGMTSDQVADAIGISGTRSFVLGIIDTPLEHNTLAKNVRFPLTAVQALTATYLARNGMTGPRRVFEGSKGLAESLLEGELDFDRLTTFGDEWFTLYAGLKAFCACYATHGHLRATVDLVREHGIRAEEVQAVEIVDSPRSMRHTGDPTVRRRVDNKETADHSSFYVTAMAISRGRVGPDEYDESLYADPQIHRLMDLTTVSSDERYAALYPAARVTIRTSRGEFEREVIHPRGHRLNPMDDDEVVEKFDMMARSRLDDAARGSVIASVQRLEELPDVAPLLNALHFPLVPDEAAVESSTPTAP